MGNFLKDIRSSKDRGAQMLNLNPSKNANFSRIASSDAEFTYRNGVSMSAMLKKNMQDKQKKEEERKQFDKILKTEPDELQEPSTESSDPFADCESDEEFLKKYFFDNIIEENISHCDTSSSDNPETSSMKNGKAIIFKRQISSNKIESFVDIPLGSSSENSYGILISE